MNDITIGVDPSTSDLVFVLIDGEDGLVDDALDTVRLAAHGSPASSLLDTKDRLSEHLRRVDPQAVAVYGTTKYGGWNLNHLRPRAMLEAALLIAAAESGVCHVEVDPHDAAKTFGCAFNLVPEEAMKRIDLAGYTKLPRRAKALAAAIHGRAETT